MTDWASMASPSALLQPIRSVRPAPVDGDALVDRLRMTAVSLGYALLMAPALALGILTILAIPLGLVAVGFVIAAGVVPATAALTALHRRLSGQLLGETIHTAYADTTGLNPVTRPMTWLTDRARWRDCRVPLVLGDRRLRDVDPAGGAPGRAGHARGRCRCSTGASGGGSWSCSTCRSWSPGGARPRRWSAARALAERNILGSRRVEELERRIEEVSTSRSETLDHSAAEVRRIERDLHDGAQARIASVGMNVGLAEKLMSTDPEAAAALLREARESTVSALEDLRSVVRGIHPPALADRGLAGGLEALALPIPLPITVTVGAPPLPPPVESAAYFAVAECLANTVKHADATRAWVRVRHDGEVLHLVVGDDGRGGADPAGSGLAGVAKRLAAFDGTMVVESPAGGPTVVTMEVPCRTSPS